ncbi:MAG TPA: hypothetical protein VHM89_11090 [Acidimicrobiales bacterium]|nr:hypothetical protein [Acidimicrobiales bacterium]
MSEPAPEPVEDCPPDPPTLQALVHEPAGTAGAEGETAGPAAALDDPVALLRRLERSGRFHRDRHLGRVYHPGALSLRENVANNSLHLSIDGNRVSAHVDRVSPLGQRPERGPRYALGRVALHNLSGMAADVARVLRGRQGDHRCELDCEWVPVVDPAAGPPDRHLPLLDPEVSPWGVHLEARVAGTLDEERLRQSLASVAPGADRLFVVDCPDDPALERVRVELQEVAVPLADTPPMRARLARHPGGDVFMLNVNHATADGPGALMVLRAVARAYAAHPVRLPPVQFLASREISVRPVAAHRRRIARKYQLALEKVRDVLARPTRLMPDHAGREPGHGFYLVTVEANDPASLAGVTDPDVDNDILVAALHLAVSVWNADHGLRDGRIAVLVPVDLRGDPWREGVVGNFSVTARVSTTSADRSSPAEALRAVAAQTARNIRSRTGTALMQALDRNGLLALWARQSVIVLQPLTANHLLDSAVLSYLGRLDAPSFGGEAGEVARLWLSTPARMPLGLSVGAAIVSGRLHLTFRHPHRLFGPEAVRRFAECYLAQIRLVASAGPVQAA